ncbi:MAG: transcriptional regulator [Thermoplasmatales archaeon]|nr:MAG: transcriptional regulator [Thermoplasmatales archaeon]
MIEITTGTIEEQIIKILQKTYPITVSDVEKKLHISRKMILRVLQKFQVKGIVQLEPLPDKIYIRLSRNDFRFVGKKRQKKFIKHHTGKKREEPGEYEGIMFS